MTQQPKQQVAAADQRAANIQEIKYQLEAQSDQLASLLPSHVKPDQFIRVALIAIQQDAGLLEADRRSLFTACQKCASDGLLPDGREAALVIFNTKVKHDGKEIWIKKAQYMPMIYGLTKKVRQSGEISEFRSRVVHEKDQWGYTLGDNETIMHQPYLDGDAGGVRAVYAIAKFKDGSIEREVMTVAQVERVRSVSKSKDSGPWRDWWDEMARKTVMRRLAKRLPLSAEIMQTLRRDDESEAEMPAIEPPPRPTRAQIAAVPSASDETSTEEANTLNRAMDREAAGEPPLAEGPPETEDPASVDTVTPAKHFPTVGPAGWDGWIKAAKVVVANAATVADVDAMVAELSNIGAPGVVVTAMAKVLDAKRKEIG